jgi:hypothetical protein
VDGLRQALIAGAVLAAAGAIATTWLLGPKCEECPNLAAESAAA